MTALEARTLRLQRTIVAMTIVVVSVAVWRAGTDVFGLAKAVVIVTAAAALVGVAAVRIGATGRVQLPVGAVGLASAAFVVALALTTVASDNPTASLTGVHGRYIGLLLYLSLLAIMLTLVRVVAADARRGPRVVLLSVFAAAVLVSGYGLIQLVGLDPLQWWSERGGGIVSTTVGNPNFVGAFLGVSAPIVAWAAHVGLAATWQRVGAVALLIGIAVLSVATETIQGPVAVAIGVLAYGTVVLSTALGSSGSRRAVFTAGGGAVVAGAALMLAGFVGAGPLATLRDAAHIGLRSYYWQAAIRMFTLEPLVGVGLGRYGSYFNEVRSVEAAAELPLAVSVDAAHSVPLDMFASGGLLLGLAYLSVIAVTVLAIVRGFTQLQGSQRFALGALVASWLAYQAQSLISLEVPLLALMHWVLTGTIIGMASPRFYVISLPWELRDGKSKRNRKAAGRAMHSRVRWLVPAAAAAVLAAGFVVVVPPLRADAYSARAAAFAAADRHDEAILLAEQAVDLAPWQPTYRRKLGLLLLDSGAFERSLDVYSELVEDDPRDLSAVVTAARLADQLDLRDRAARYYELAEALEPRSPELREEIAAFRG